MGMVTEHELTARYAAGSLGGTLERLNESLRRLSRSCSTGAREKPRGLNGRWFVEPAEVTHLNQTLRLMADAWQAKTNASRPFEHIGKQFEQLKENALNLLGRHKNGFGQRSEYQILAQALDDLKISSQSWM